METSLEIQPPSFFVRFGAGIIDLFIVSLIQLIFLSFFILVELIAFLSNLPELNIEVIFEFFKLMLFSSVISVLVACLYYPLSYILIGNSLGKKLFKLKLLRYDNAVLSSFNIYLREVGKYFLIDLTYGVELLLYFYKGQNLTLHDRLFKTKVTKI